MTDWTIDDVILKPAQAVTAMREAKARQRDLLEANNRYLEEARAARLTTAVLRGCLDRWTRGQPDFDFITHLARQRAFSESTFGPGKRTKGVADHIRKELAEIEANPTDILEWIDVVILALDGAWRAGFTPDQIVEALAAKQTRNEARVWPDWRTADPSRAIEHVRTEEGAGA